MTSRGAFTLPARPDSYPVRLAETALVVVDMQNGSCSKGGYFDLAGFEPDGTVIDAVSQAVDMARGVDIPVVWLQNGWDKELIEGGGLYSPNRIKGNALRLMREKPELRGKLLTKGGWDYALVDELKPNEGEYVVAKPRYSGFAGTNLDLHLRGLGVRTLLICGVATNVCVESTIRDAFFLEYHPVMIADACRQAGPDFLQEATIYNVERFFGWTTSLAELKQAFHRRATHDCATRNS